jgi:sugar phosphate isomerase/epimerase
MKLALSATPTATQTAPFLLRRSTPADAFAIARRLGCEGVELHLRHASDVDTNDVLDLAARHSLQVPTLGTGLAAGIDGLAFSSPDASVRRRAVERVKGHVELAARLGSAVIIGSLSGRVGPDPARRGELRNAALGCLGECCRAATSAGVTMLLEPLNRYECDYLNTVRDVLCVIEELGAPNLKVLADTFHMNIEEADISESLRLAGPLLGHVHLADSNRRAPGHGHLDIPPVLRTLEAIGYQGYLSFEVFPIPDAETAAADAVRTVREALARLKGDSGPHPHVRAEKDKDIV